MASVSGSIQDLVDALGRQEHDAAYKLVYTYWTKANMSTDCCLNLMQPSRVIGRLWLMYIHMVLILKMIDAERAGLWQQHLTEVGNMLPYMIPVGHIN